MDEQGIHQAIGRHEARLDGIDGRMKKYEDKQDRVLEKVGAMHDLMMQSQGGFKAMMMFGAFCAAVAGVFGSLVTYFKVK